MTWEIEGKKKKSEENMQLGSQNPSGFDYRGQGARRTGWKWKGREEPVLYCTWTLKGRMTNSTHPLHIQFIPGLRSVPFQFTSFIQSPLSTTSSNAAIT